MRALVGATLLAAIGTALLSSRHASAGAVTLFVTDRPDKGCPLADGRRRDPEEIWHFFSSERMVAALREYFATNELRTEMAAGIVNAGIRFCGKEESRIVFEFLADALSAPKPPGRIFEVIVNYCRSDLLSASVRERLARKGISGSFRSNLKRAEAEILECRRGKRQKRPR